MLSVFPCSIVLHFHVLRQTLFLNPKIINSTRLVDYEFQASPSVHTHRVDLEVHASCLASYVDSEGMNSGTLCLFPGQSTV